MATPTTTEESKTETKGKISGSCTCGKVSYEAVIDTPEIGIVYCHCTDCQEAHTAPYIGAFLLPEANVAWTGMDTMLSYDRRGTNLRKFCSTCGMHIACHKQMYKMFAIFPQSIKESTLPVKPVMHIMTKEKDPMIKLPADGLPRLEGFPS